MKRLLIVDDEHHIVNWLVELFEEQTEMDLTIFKAYSGLEAINILEVTKINIILLDINMPGINGLELADKILSDWPGSRIIFLTGFNNFDYIYYANKHNNISYLLKTEPDEEIIKAVSNAVNSIDLEIRNIELQNQMIHKEKLLNYLFQRDFLKDIILGKPLKQIKEHMDWFGYHFQLDLSKSIFLLYGKYNTKNNSPFCYEHNNFILMMMQITEQVLYNKFNYAILASDNTTVLWFLQPSASFIENNRQSPVVYIKECFDELIFSVQNNMSSEIMLLLYHKEISLAITGNIYQLLNQYISSSSPAFITRSFGMLFGDNEERLINEHNKKLIRFNQWDEQLNHLQDYLSHGKQHEFLKVLRDISLSSNHIKSMHYLPLISIYQRISSIIIKFISQWNLNEEIAPRIGLYPLFYIKDFKSWAEAFYYLEKIVFVVFDLSSHVHMDKNQKLISAIENYIKEHLSEDLTLTVISDYVNYNSSYVSRLFKQTTGLSLSDYIKLCRLNKAKDLLNKTDDTVQVIAQKVGFDTSQYFSMVFRKSTGISPRDFRNQVQK